MATLTKAAHQWATRPADERPWDLDEMAARLRLQRERSGVASAYFNDLRVQADGDDLMLLGKKGVPANLTHWAFGQLCARTKAPAAYLRQLPATLAAQNLNHHLKASDPADATELMFRATGSREFEMVCAMSDQYQRVWNHLIVEALRSKVSGWMVPPARPAGIAGERTRKATEADVLKISTQNARLAGGPTIKVGDTIAPSGLYVSDRDMFIFMVDEEHGVDDGTGHQLARGFFIENSEVGKGSYVITTFYYDAICGNHFVWGAQGVTDIRMRHIGEGMIERAFENLNRQLHGYSNEGARLIEANIKAARAYKLGDTKDDVVDAVLKAAPKTMTKKLAVAAYETAEKVERYGAPTHLWGMINGLTELSQQRSYADDRTDIDRTAGDLMRIVF